MAQMQQPRDQTASRAARGEVQPTRTSAVSACLRAGTRSATPGVTFRFAGFGSPSEDRGWSLFSLRFETLSSELGLMLSTSAVCRAQEGSQWVEVEMVLILSGLGRRSGWSQQAISSSPGTPRWSAQQVKGVHSVLVSTKVSLKHHEIH